MELEKLRYPIGKFNPLQFSPTLLASWIQDIENLPELLTKAAKGLSETQLDTPYRPEGWTLRQVVHHIADSHMNAYIRFRWAMTEENPLIKAYEEQLWAELDDARNEKIEISLNLISSLHQRWVRLLRSMQTTDFQRTLQHPVTGIHSLEKMTGMYSWHGRHHTAHLVELRKRMNW